MVHSLLQRLHWTRSQVRERTAIRRLFGPRVSISFLSLGFSVSRFFTRRHLGHAALRPRTPWYFLHFVFTCLSLSHSFLLFILPLLHCQPGRQAARNSSDCKTRVSKKLLKLKLIAENEFKLELLELK